MLFQILAVWGCIPEITKNCIDMTNTSSTYLSIALGATVGAVKAGGSITCKREPLLSRMRLSDA
jgi:hypothetical protein